MLDELRKFLDVVVDLAQSLRQFNEDLELRKTAEALYVAMLRMIDACIKSLVHESTCKNTPTCNLGGVLTISRGEI
jgi:hypothetical protein